jgi:hypothetical protein
MTVASDLADFAAAVAQITVDSELYTQLISGPSTGDDSIVHTDDGDVKTLPRILAELEALYTSTISNQNESPDSTVDGVVTRPVGVVELLTSMLAALGALEVTIEPGDVNIGAVELKDGATDNRAAVANADLLANSSAYALAVRVVGLLQTLGEVQASPAANTVLDRLKAVATALSVVTKTSVSFTVASGASESAAVDIQQAFLASIMTPVDLKGLSSITAIMISNDGATGWTTAADRNGDPLAAFPLTVSYHLGLEDAEAALRGAAYAKLVFNTTASGALTFIGRCVA